MIEFPRLNSSSCVQNVQTSGTFHRGTSGYVEKSAFVFICKFPVPLRDVQWNRSGGSLQLIPNGKTLWKVLNDLGYICDKLYGFAVYLEFLMVESCRHSEIGIVIGIEIFSETNSGPGSGS